MALKRLLVARCDSVKDGQKCKSVAALDYSLNSIANIGRALREIGWVYAGGKIICADCRFGHEVPSRIGDGI